MSRAKTPAANLLRSNAGRSLFDEPLSFVYIELHQAFISHFQQEGLASFFIRDIGAFHNLVHFKRLLAERIQDIFSIIQHDQTPTAIERAKSPDSTKADLP
jgi:hypothetical protein